jgi:hypothetical protein
MKYEPYNMSVDQHYEEQVTLPEFPITGMNKIDPEYCGRVILQCVTDTPLPEGNMGGREQPTFSDTSSHTLQAIHCGL